MRLRTRQTGTFGPDSGRHKQPRSVPMTRCLVLAAVAGLLGSLVWFTQSGAVGVSAVEQQRPNVVFIMVDDMRADDLAAMPNTRRLLGGTNGARYTNAYVSTPLCCPSRATFLTGQHGHNNGVWDNMGDHGGVDALDDSSTLPVWLQRAGYQTSMIGKYLNGVGNPDDGVEATYIPPGWTRWAALTQPTTSRYTDFDLSVGDSTSDSPGSGTMRHVDRHQTLELTSRAVHRVQTWAPGDPMFMWLSYFAPHGGGHHDGPTIPVPPKYDGISHAGLPTSAAVDEIKVGDKPAWVERLPRLIDTDVDRIVEERNERRDALHVVDDGVANLVTALRASGELDNTVIMFMSDNGVMQGEHRVKGGKRFPYLEAARVPLLIRGPGFTPGTHTEPVSNVDLAPTIADLADVTPGLTVDGISLLDPVPADRPILVEYLGHQTPNGMPTYSSVIQGREQYTEYEHGRELYDLADDPWQRRNRIADPGSRTTRLDLASVLDQLRDCVGEECR